MSKTIDELVDQFDIDSKFHDGSRETGVPMTFWLPSEYKVRYDLLQERSRRKFGKLLKEVLKRSIDRVKIA